MQVGRLALASFLHASAALWNGISAVDSVKDAI
jgi:hypothetical protein